MRTNRFFTHQCTLIALILCLLSSLLIQAQTYNGQSALGKVPVSLRTIITPVPNSSIVRVRFENQGRGTVQLQIRDRKGKTIYDETVPKRSYAGQLDLGSLPAGLYILELHTVDARYTEMIRVESPGNGRVVALVEPTGEGKAIVKQ